MQFFNHIYRQWVLLLALLLTIPSVYANPIANFVITPSTGCVPIRIFLDASSSQPSAGAQITSYQWQISTGQGILSREVSSIYLNNAGTYTFTLTVTDSTGLTASIPKSVTMLPTGSSNCEGEGTPFAQFNATPISGSLQVALDASASTGTISDYQWESNGLYIPEDKITTVTYPQAGTYTITLTVKSLSGATDSMSKTVTVGNVTSSSQVTFNSGTNLLTIPDVLVDGSVHFMVEMEMMPDTGLFQLKTASPK